MTAHRFFQTWVTFCGLASLSILAGCQSAPSPPRLLNAVYAQGDETEERTAALTKVSASPFNEVRIFFPVFEHHYGLYFVPVEARDELIWVDFDDPKIRDRFVEDYPPNQDYPPGEIPSFLGKKVICECRGISWFFQSEPRFLVREAKFVIVP